MINTKEHRFRDSMRHGCREFVGYPEYDNHGQELGHHRLKRWGGVGDRHCPFLHRTGAFLFHSIAKGILKSSISYSIYNGRTGFAAG
jgi:hypothetical protein